MLGIHHQAGGGLEKTLDKLADGGFVQSIKICRPRVKSSPVPVVSLSIGSQPSNSTWHQLHLLILSSDQTGPKAYIAGHHVKC